MRDRIDGRARAAIAGVCSFALSAGTTAFGAPTVSTLEGISLGGGIGIRSPRANLGGEFTLNATDSVELGGSFDHSFLQYDDRTGGSLRFFSLVGRYHFTGRAGGFADLKIGVSQRTAGDRSSGLAPGAGLGIGYRIELGDHFSLSPRVGLRYLPNGKAERIDTIQTGALVDAGVMLSFHF